MWFYVTETEIFDQKTFDQLCQKNDPLVDQATLAWSYDEALLIQEELYAEVIQPRYQ